VAVRRRVEQDRADREPDRDVHGAFERHVDRPVGDLRRGAREVDDHVAAVDGDRDGERQILA
jgi:hypothetical protein